jgi:hypothetical protein
MAFHIMHGCLAALCILHYYWIVLFLNMYIRAIMAGDTDDKQRGVKDKDTGKVIVASDLKPTKVD